ncbi:MAG: thiolase family protein [Dethiobacter sp.]|jgi:acetyl-CoA C-acetyltransferase|nr:thiolase family protein [Dethiobacter sp.]
MENIVITAAVRTAIGDFGGAFKDVMPNELAAAAIKEAVKRSSLQPTQIDEVILGNCIMRSDEANIARVAALKAGIAMETPAFTVQRQCSSGMQAVVSGYQEIALGDCEIVVAGGTEGMSCAPYVLKSSRWGQRLQHGEMTDMLWELLHDPNYNIIMGMTAENLAEKYGISREEQDEVACRSHINAANAVANGHFKDQIVPFEISTRKGVKVVDTDEHPRAEITREDLAKLKPVFKQNGTVTAGNSSGLNDGAAALVLMKETKAGELGIKPLARVVSYAWAAVEPWLMGYGPVPATQKLLKKAGVSLADIELIELNEAFAAQYLACEKLLGLNRDIVNVNGSGVGLGHPVGATGARIIVSLIYELKRRGLKLGMASLCVGGGMGMSILIENL